MAQSPLLFLFSGRGLMWPWDFSPQTFPGNLSGRNTLEFGVRPGCPHSLYGVGGCWWLRPALRGNSPCLPSTPQLPLTVVVIQIPAHTVVTHKITAPTLTFSPRTLGFLVSLVVQAYHPQCCLTLEWQATLDPSLKQVSKAWTLSVVTLYCNQKTYIFPLGSDILTMCVLRWNSV